MTTAPVNTPSSRQRRTLAAAPWNTFLSSHQGGEGERGHEKCVSAHLPACPVPCFADIWLQQCKPKGGGFYSRYLAFYDKNSAIVFSAKKEVTRTFIDEQASSPLLYAFLKSESGGHSQYHRAFLTLIHVRQDGLRLAEGSDPTQDAKPPPCPTLTQPEHLPVQSRPNIHAVKHHLTLLNAIIYLPLPGKWKMNIKWPKNGIPLCEASAAQSTNKLYLPRWI